LAETKVFDEEDAAKLIRNVQENNVRWMIEGRSIVKKLIVDWNETQPKRRSAPAIKGLHLNEFQND